jgi:hypothetical protein
LQHLVEGEEEEDLVDVMREDGERQRLGQWLSVCPKPPRRGRERVEHGLVDLGAERVQDYGEEREEGKMRR